MMEVSKSDRKQKGKRKSTADRPSAFDVDAVPGRLALADLTIGDDEEKNENDVRTDVIDNRTMEIENAKKEMKHDADESTANAALQPGAEKDAEGRRSSSFVRELPLEALLRSNSRDELAASATVESLSADKTRADDEDKTVSDDGAVASTATTVSPELTANTMVTALPASATITTYSIYPPLVGQMEPVIGLIEIPENAIREKPKDPKALIVPTISVEEAPPATAIYPRLAGSVGVSAPECSALVAAGEAELLSEGQLLEFYRNDQLDFVDDFVDVFVHMEMEPRNCLFDLLQKYKRVCDELEEVVNVKATSARTLAELNGEVWTVESRKVVQQGKCQCGRSASGEALYKAAAFRPEKLVALSEELGRLNRSELDIGFCLEIRSRALALQIQWAVVDVVNAFFVEHQLTAASLPMLSAAHSLPSRVQLRKALSDLFYHMRYPALTARFRNSVTGWISELGAALMKACTPDDQLFVLAQLLRCPSPLGAWAVGLVQTFVGAPNHADLATPVDGFVAMMSLLLRSIRNREQFMCRVIKYYEGENSWNFVADDGGSIELNNMSELTETDFVALLAQFDVKALFAVALRNFTFVHKGNRLQVILSLISFVLVFLKICDEGLETYVTMRGMAKNICDHIRNIVQCFCHYWNLTRAELNDADRTLIQNEVNRILLQAAYYIVSKNSVDLWQFLVDFPYGSVTEFCRMRFQLLFRHSTTMSIRDLYEIPDAELIARLRSSRNLWEQLCKLRRGKEDATYKVLALSSVISHCALELNFLVFQVIHLCFLDEATRDDYYKVGSEAVALFLERNRALLPLLLKYIDRHVDHLDRYAVDILSNASKALRECQISVNDVANVLGKWLINRAIDHPASQIARRVLCSMNWGGGRDGVLWLPADVHDACADTIVKAHIVHCKAQNGMIAKSVSKATKLALKCSDLEQQFGKFCWDVLIKLKITEKSMSSPPTTSDLAAFYIFIQQKCLQTRSGFLDHGLPLFVDLVNASAFKPAIQILGQVVSRFESAIDVFISNPVFRKCVEQIIHADESAYAVQLIVGADDFPGPVLSLLGAEIEYQIHVEESVARSKRLALAWLQVLTCRKTIEWNSDKFALYLIGFIAKAAVIYDPDTLFGIGEVFENLYRAQYGAWRDSSKGILSWFATQIHPPLIADDLLDVAPWTSFVLLRVEPRLFGAFYEFLDTSMCKHPARSLDEALKKACSKSHNYFTVDRLHFARWLEFLSREVVIEHEEVFPLALQQLCCLLLERKAYERRKHCVGQRLLRCPAVEPLVGRLRNLTLPRLEKAADAPKLVSFYRAVPQWLCAEEVYDPEFSRFSDYILDYLLHTAVAGDEHLWMELVKTNEVQRGVDANIKTFINCYYVLATNDTPAVGPQSPSKIGSMTAFFAWLEHTPSRAATVPATPAHQGLPASEKAEPSWYGISPLPLVFTRHLDELSKAAKNFVTRKEAVDALNTAYLELFQKLYVDSEETLRISLKCGNFMTSRCPRPANSELKVTASNYDQKIASQMNDNRTKREEEIGQLFLILDGVAITCAQLEHIAGILNRFSQTVVYSQSGDSDFVRTTGVNIFYKICNFVDGVQFLFSAAVQCYEACLDTLGKAFIAENPAEQINLMRIVKAGNPLNHFLVTHFTPHCIAPTLLFQLYSELSHSVRDPNTSEASLALLSRLDIEHSGNRMPANQFLALMPMIFENIAYVAATSPLRQLCMDHFVHAVFHHFPFNFVTGLKLILSGLDSQAVPAELLLRIIARFDDFAVVVDEPYSLKMAQRERALTAEQALDCLRIIAGQLASSRRLLSNRLFAAWSQYLESVGRLAAYLFRLVVYQKFNSDASTSVIETELRDFFHLLASVWGPLLEPLDVGLPPWGVSEAVLATTLFEVLVGQLNWLPHSVYLPPGAETVESLFWQYFTSKLIVGLPRTGAAHVFSVYEAKIVRMNWVRFWPTLLDLDAMEKAIANGPADLCPLVVEIVVRVPWSLLLQQQAAGVQPHDANRAFASLILSIMAFCIHRSVNYAKSRASMETLLRLFLDGVHWPDVKMETVETIGEFIGGHLPPDILLPSSTTNDILKTFLCIWREVCYFSPLSAAAVARRVPDNQSPTDDPYMNLKRSIYIRTHLALMLRSSMEREERQKFYREVLNKTNQLITLDNPMIYADMARQLTFFWTKISKEKDVNAMLHTLTDWLREHCESSLLLLIASTGGAKLSVPVGLHLLDECVAIYFLRRLSCEWTEIIRWLNIPKRSSEWLYTTPRSDSDVQPRFFVLNAHLMADLSRSRSPADECKILRRLSDYLSSIKPKYITNEAAFLLCVEKWQRMVVRQFENGVVISAANEELDIYTKWLRRVYADERGGSIFAVVAKLAARKPTFPIRLQAFANIMELYFTQQYRSASQPPRLAGGQPVLNSRIHAFNELKQQKQYQELLSSGVFVNSQPYFINADTHHLGQAMELFTMLARSLYLNEKFLQF